MALLTTHLNGDVRQKYRYAILGFLGFLGYLALYILPLLTQWPEPSRWILRLWNGYTSCVELTRLTVWIAILTAAAGFLIFTGWRRLCWCSLVLILVLAMMRGAAAANQWSCWKEATSANLYMGYSIELAALVIIPLHALLWKAGWPVRQWARVSVILVAVMQSVVCAIQFFCITSGNSSLLEAWGISSSALTPRDSQMVYVNAVRLTGLTRSPNLLAMVLVLTWPALLWLRVPGKTGNTKRWLLGTLRAILIATAIFAVVLTYTRAAYVGLLLQTCAVLLLTWRRRNRTAWLWNAVVIAASLFLSLMIAPASGARAGAIADTADASITNRLAVYRIAVSLLAERPLSGWGPGFFNTLYNRFYKLPYEPYSFYDAHSAVLNGLLEIGLIGALLFGLFLCGFHGSTFFRRLPAWAWLGPLGACVPLLSDNPVFSPDFLFPAIWVMGIWVTTALETEARMTRIQSRATVLWKPMLAVGGLFALWMIGYLQPMKSPDQRFVESLRKAWPAGTRHLSFYVQDFKTRRTWEMNADEPIEGASIAKLAIASALIGKYGQDANISSESLNLEKARAKGSGILHVLPRPPEQQTVGNSLYLMLAQSDNTSANSLLDLVGTDEVSSWALQLTGRPADFKYGFGRNEIGAADQTEEDESAYSGAKLTARQCAGFMTNIMETSSPLAQIARAALARNVNRWGMNRYLRTEGKGLIYHKSGTADHFKNDCLVFKTDDAYWVASIMSRGQYKFVGIDNPGFVALAKCGWICSLYLRP